MSDTFNNLTNLLTNPLTTILLSVSLTAQGKRKERVLTTVHRNNIFVLLFNVHLLVFMDHESIGA
jgi:hypothetical protein